MMDSSGKLHVMHVLGSFGPGGAEMGAVRLTRALPPEAFRHSVCSIRPEVTLSSLLAQDVPCQSLGLTGRTYTAFRPLAKLAREQRVDILHVNNLAPWAEALVASRLAGCACVATFHGVEADHQPFTWAKRRIFSVLARKSAAVTAVSEGARNLLEELTGLDRREVRVINNGVDCAEFLPSRGEGEKRQMRIRLGLPARSIVLGCVAGLRPVKGHGGLLRAFARLPISEPVHLVLIGSGPEEGFLKSLVAELGVGERVHFLGQCEAVPELLRVFDLFVLNSATEGLSYAVLEAMASGLPVLATAVGANPELIEQDRNGWLYPPHDETACTQTLAAAMAKRDHWPTLGQRGRERVEKSFGISAMAQHYADLYRAVKERNEKAFQDSGSGKEST